MNGPREALLKAQTEIIYAAMTGGLRLPDETLAGIFGGLKRASEVLSGGGPETDEQQPTLAAELEGFFREGGPLAEALRKMVLEARPSQMKSVIRGYLVNYVYDW